MVLLVAIQALTLSLVAVLMIILVIYLANTHRSSVSTFLSNSVKRLSIISGSKLSTNGDDDVEDTYKRYSMVDWDIKDDIEFEPMVTIKLSP